MHIILLKKLLRKPKILKNRKYFLKSNTFVYLIHEVLIRSFLMHGSILLKKFLNAWIHITENMMIYILIAFKNK